MPYDPAFPRLTLTAENAAASRGGRAVFANVSFTLHNGDALAVLGPNGAGKSTLLRVVAGLLKPAAGAIVLSPGNIDPGHSAHYAGHLDALKAAISVEQNLAFWARLWGADPAGIDVALDRVGLGALASLPVGVLSAGQRRRAALARLLISRRPLWLLDEPTASLDAAAEATLGAIIAGHLADGGIALIATHATLPMAHTHELTLGAP